VSLQSERSDVRVDQVLKRHPHPVHRSAGVAPFKQLPLKFVTSYYNRIILYFLHFGSDNFAEVWYFQ
jgi:hypothetical protein